ncbi:unnamed protein product [Caenorhabditis auriculariae]|uniref:G-protein coupled receptors family 1 profile domain-containing protein n=1 Tax=Caenorhabditis auriculariae TaxID=2777116 RepID=A0A8S1HVG1_9PELO|nr:unnamed protein product [Caenorhabditis auriculariae]
MEELTTTTASTFIETLDTPTAADFIAAAVIFLISIIGLTGNTCVFLFSSTLKSLRNSFGRFSSSQAFAEAILCATFAFFYCPMVVFGVDVFMRSSSYVGLVLLYCYDVCMFSHLFIAVNRLCAIAFPLRYDSLFNDRNTKILIFLAYAFASFSSIYMHLTNNCLLPYVKFGWYFGVNTSAKCDVIRFYIDFCKDFFIVSQIVIVNVVTLVLIHMMSKSKSKQTSNWTGIHSKRRAMEVKFAKQVALQGLTFSTELILFFIVSARQSNPWMIFLCTTVAWSAVHSIDPLIIILLNAEFRQLLRGKKTSSTVQNSELNTNAI